MSKLTEAERLVKLETLLEKLYAEFAEFRLEMKEANANFVSSQKHEDDLLDLKREITRTKKRIDQIEKSKWIQNTLSAVLGAILSLLVAYFINNVGV